MTEQEFNQLAREGYNRGRPVAELDLDAVVPSLLEASKLITQA